MWTASPVDVQCHSAAQAGRKGIVMNVVVLRGRISSSLVTRDLVGGGRAVSFDLATDTGSGRASVPASWIDPPALPDWPEGHEVVICGLVRRRFFRSGGATQSRTEVMVTEAVEARKRQQVRKMLDRVTARLADGS